MKESRLIITDQEIYTASVAMTALEIIIKDGFGARVIEYLKEEEALTNKRFRMQLKSINKKFKKRLKEYDTTKSKPS